jgi:peroxiredoxin
MTLETGMPAPDFELRDQHGRPVRLSALRGEAAALVMFYPYAFSRVCTGELTALREHLPRLAATGARLLAVSCDPMFTLRALADRDGLEFPLLSDFWPHGAVATAYGVFDAEHGCAQRSSFVVDRDGVLRWSVHSPMGEARDPEEPLRVLAGLV